MSDVPTIHDYLAALGRLGPEGAAAEMARGRVHPDPAAWEAVGAAKPVREQARQGGLL